MATPRKTTNLVAETPELDHTDLAIFSGDGKIDEEKPPKLRWPVLGGGNAFEIVTQLAKVSPVSIRVRLWRYAPNSGSGTVVSTHDVPAGTYTHYFPIDVNVERAEQLSVSFEPIGDPGPDPADGVVVLVRIAT